MFDYTAIADRLRTVSWRTDVVNRFTGSTIPREIKRTQNKTNKQKKVPTSTKEEYKKRLLLRCIHHFKSDLIYNMDRTEPSSVILSQKGIRKLDQYIKV